MTIAEIIVRAGGPTKLGAIVGRHHSTVLGWKHVPARHARAVAQALRVPVEDILPPPPAPADRQEEIAA